MAPTKRPHERGPSLSFRPHKSARAFENANLDQSSAEGRMSLDGDTPSLTQPPQQVQSLWENLQMISTSEPVVVPPLNFLGRLARPLTSFDISGITAWPSSLGAIRNGFRYNLTPQHGRQLPTSVLNLTAWRQMRSSSSDHPNFSTRPPYLHLGFASWLNIDVFVFLPYLSLDACSNHDHGAIQEHVLEAWTDRILLPALHDGDSRAPPSWQTSKMNSTHPMWYDPSIADFPTHEIYNGSHLSLIWQKVQQNSTTIPDFQDPFLVMYLDKRLTGTFTGANPEMVFQDFEQAWMEEIDTRYVGLDQDNLKISISCDVVV